MSTAPLTDAQRVGNLEAYIDNATPHAPAGALIGQRALKSATELVSMVRDEGPDTLGEYLDRRDRQALYGLVVTLAAMVPDDRSVEDLLEWLPVASSATMTPEAMARHAAKRRAKRAATRAAS